MKITDVSVDRLLYPVENPFWAGKGRWSADEGGRKHLARGAVLVRIHTDEGIVGVGEAGVFGSPPVVMAAAVEHYLKPLVVGEDPFKVEHLWRKAHNYMGGNGRRGLLFGALSGIDIALWDLIGKALGAPLYRVLGAYRDRVPAYATGGFYSEGKGVKELADEVAGYVAQGFRAVKIKIGALSIAKDVARVEAVRRAVGDGCRLMVDANTVYSPAEAIRMARAIQHLDIAYFEEPVRTDDLDGSARVSAQGGIPVAGYETEFGLYAFRELIARRAVDVAQPDPIYSGGITECRKIAALAAAHDVECSVHGFASGISLACNLHLLASLPNGGMLELDRTANALREEILEEPLMIGEDGCVGLPQKPGLGVTLNEDAIERYRV